MMTEKNVNYTPEMTELVVTRYRAGTNEEERTQILQELSAETGKQVKSLVAKLVREGCYIKKVYKKKDKSDVETKDKIVATIATAMDVTEAQLNGLEKATKPALLLIRERVIAATEKIS